MTSVFSINGFAMQKRKTSAHSLRGATYYSCAVPPSSRKTDLLQPSLRSGCVSSGVWRIVLLFLNKATPASVQKEFRDWKKLEALFLYCLCKHKPRILIEIFNCKALTVVAGPRTVMVPKELLQPN